MAEGTKIEWADHTFNPWIGCTKVSPACDHCYAEAQASRYWPGEQLWAGNRKRTSANNWRQPLKWNRQAAEFRAKHGRAPMVFCASLADVFDNQVPDQWREDLWRLIEATPDLVWLLLTKRPQNIRKMLPPFPDTGEMEIDPWGNGWPNVWLGTTVENQAEADRRIPHLLSVPAAKRFLSCEPLLGPVDLTQYVNIAGGAFIDDPLAGALMADAVEDGAGWVRPCVDWVIAGGESGPHARPSHPHWFRGLRDQCAAAGVPFLFKQWGEWIEGAQTEDTRAAQLAHKAYRAGDLSRAHFDLGGAQMLRVSKRDNGRTLDGVIHDGRPEA